MITRVFLYVLLLVTLVIVPWWLLILCLFVYALRYTAYELIALGFIIDGLYGFGYPLSLPYYTLGIVIGLICIEWLKPHISVYNQ